MSSSSGTKRQRVEEEQPDTVDVKLSEELRELMGGRTYVKEEELTRDVLLEWAKRQGAVKEVNLISVTVQSMGGTEVEVKLEDSDNTVRSLKQNIQDSQGISSFSQQLFLVSKKGSDKADELAEAKQEPMGDDQLLLVDCCVALCIDAEVLTSWDSSSPLITNKIFELTGKDNIIATKIDQNNYDNCLWANRVMESGKHRMSLKLIKGEVGDLYHFFGLVRDGAAWDKNHCNRASTDAWYMNSSGYLCGNGKRGDDYAGEINEGQIVSMEADLDKGTLRFWVDGKPHGPGHSSGVTGRLRWAVCLYRKGTAVEIVPTPELQPWTPWVPPDY